MAADLLPELLLGGHLIDRSGMPHLIAAFGRDGMRDVAIEEWAAASPVYTRRMRDALGLTGHGVTDMFKCLQHDIGAPPQFMDFRFTVYDEQHGGFELAHCGALMDVEPMGEDYVIAMCHDIEDPTFDATAVATDPTARIRPVHRPPRRPADRHPHCAWTVTIGSDPPLRPVLDLEDTHAARFVSDFGGEGYPGPLLGDVDWAAYSPQMRARLADEIAIQWHLLGLGFARAVRRRPCDADMLIRKQVTGIAGLMSERLRPYVGSLAELVAVHPVLGPAAYTGVSFDGDRIVLDPQAPAYADDGWLPQIDDRVLDALVRGYDPALVDGPECEEVALTRFSTGAAFAFEPRRSLPLTVL